jgi:K+-transporting ATPase ATPase C chain
MVLDPVKRVHNLKNKKYYMKQHILPAIKLTAVCIIFFTGIYPLFIWGIAQAAPNNGKGETIEVNGKVVGYKLIGQKFTEDKYFWGRPSAVDYNAAGSGGSNKGPTNPDYLKTVRNRIDTFLVHNPGIKKEAIPSELVTASGSGQDPNLSPAAAKVQVKRIAAVRKIDENKLYALIDEQNEGPLLGMFGPSKVNVLKLNIALDELK